MNLVVDLLNRGDLKSILLGGSHVSLSLLSCQILLLMIYRKCNEYNRIH